MLTFILGWWWLLQDFGELENFANLLVRKTPQAATGKVHWSQGSPGGKILVTAFTAVLERQR